MEQSSQQEKQYIYIYLGVTVDEELRFKSHIDRIVKKGKHFRLNIAGIARRWGAELRYLRRSFTAVVALRLDYGAVIWHKQEDPRTAPRTWQIRKINCQLFEG